MKRYAFFLLIVLGMVSMPVVYGAIHLPEEEFEVPMPDGVPLMVHQLKIEGEYVTESIIVGAYKEAVERMRFRYGSPRDLHREIGRLDKVRDFFLDYIYRACVDSIDVVGFCCPECKQEECERGFTHQELVKKLDEALAQKRSEFADYPNRLAFLNRAEEFLKKNLPSESSNVNS